MARAAYAARAICVTDNNNSTTREPWYPKKLRRFFVKANNNYYFCIVNKHNPPDRYRLIQHNHKHYQMNKFYTLALSAAVCLSASAFERTQPAQSTTVPFDIPANMAIDNHGLSRNKAPRSRAGMTLQDYAGTYIWSRTNPRNAEKSEAEVSIEIVDEATGEIRIEGVCTPYPLQGVVNAEANIIGIVNKQKLFDDEDGPVYFYVKTGQGNQILPGPVSDDFTAGEMIGNTITFLPYDIWVAGDFENESLGYYFMYCMNTFTKFVEDDTEWEDYCTGTLVDGWITSGAGVNPEDFPWAVSIQKQVGNDNVYRVYNPYAAEDSPYADKAKGNGSIKFDLSDTEFVTVKTGIYSGFTDNEYGRFFLFNLEGYYTNLGFTKDEITSELTDMEWSTYSNNVVNIPTCRFDIDRACERALVWQDSQGASLADTMKAKIIFDKAPAIDSIQDVCADESNGEVEYYNMQGVRIAKPANGICIRVQGGKATKVVARN